MAHFDLLGATGDETRMLVERTSGYSVPLPGYPSPVLVVASTPKYDAMVVLGGATTDPGAPASALRVAHGFRLDEVPAGPEPRALAQALVTAYAANRAASPARPRPIPDRLRPGTVAGGQATYPLRDAADPTIEQLWVLVRPSPQGFWALHHTTRFRTADLNALQWAHLRSLVVDKHHWDPDAPRTTAPAMYPPSAFARPAAKLDLTDEAWHEATAKARDVGPLADEQTTALADLLVEIAQTDDPPSTPVIPPLLQLHMRKIAMCGPTRAAEALLRNLQACKTMFDLRAWCWQCAWAIGNREGRGPEQRTNR